MYISHKLTDDNLLNSKRPLIFVPGIRTSRLAIRKENGSLENFWPLMPHEFLIRSKLDRVFHYLETNIPVRADDSDDDIKVVATSLIPFAYDGLIKSDRKSTRLNSSHANISYAVFCLKKKTILP